MSQALTSAINAFLPTAGARLYYGNTGTGGVYADATTAVGGIDKWDQIPGGFKINKLDTTRADQVLSDGTPDWVTQQQPLHEEPTELKITVGFGGANVTTLQGLKRTVKSWKILFSNGYFIPFTGWLSEMSTSADKKGEVFVSFTIQPITVGVFTPPA